MHTASDSTRRSRYTTLWFRTCANILLYGHRAHGDFRGANATLSMCMGFKPYSLSISLHIIAHAHRRRCRLALSVRSLALKLAHVLFNCGMFTASDSTRRSRYTTLWFRTCEVTHAQTLQKLLTYININNRRGSLQNFITKI